MKTDSKFANTSSQGLNWFWLVVNLSAWSRPGDGFGDKRQLAKSVSRSNEQLNEKRF